MQLNFQHKLYRFISLRGLKALGWVAIAANVILVIFFFHARNMYHVDEMFSFGHANSTQGAFFTPGVTSSFTLQEYQWYWWYRWHPGRSFHTWLTVQPGEAFHYKHIFDNLAVGVHPPLFYMLLHTVCSFTPDVFSKWQGAALNIPLWLLLLWMIFRLAKLFFKDSFYAWSVTLFYAYSEVGLDTVLFIRGYLLQTLLAVCLVDQVTRLLKENKADGLRYLCIGGVATLGMLTHYNFLVFTAVVGLIAGLILCVRRQWRLCWRLGITLVASAAVFLVIFPPVMDVLVNSHRGQQTISHFTVDSIRSFLLQFKWKGPASEYLALLWHGAAENWFLLYMGLIVMLGYKYMKTKADRLVDWLLCVMVVMWGYSFFAMPEMSAYGIRYTMFIYPLAAIVTVWYLAFLIGLVVREPKEKWTKRLVTLIIGLNAVGSIVGFAWESPFAFHTKQLYDAQDFKDKRIIVQSSYTFLDGAYALAEAKAVYLMPPIRVVDEFAKELTQADVLLRPRVVDGFGVLPDLECEAPSLCERVAWKRTFRWGVRLYDEYEIKHSTAPTGEKHHA